MKVRTRSLLVAAVVSVAALVAVNVIVEGRIEESFRSDLAASLRTVLNTTLSGLEALAKTERRTAEFWAGQPEVHDAARVLLEMRHERMSLLYAPEQRELRARLRDLTDQPGHKGYLVIALDGVNLASSSNENVGAVTEDLLHQRWLFDRLRRDSALSHPFLSDVPLPDESGRLALRQPTMFAVAPIKTNTGEVMAYFAVNVPPTLTFTTLLRTGRPRMSGETYAFDDSGKFLSESRFDEELQSTGQILGTQSAMLRFLVRVPSDGRPLTRAADEAIRGAPGVDLDGYLDYRGVPVVGAWTWSRDLQLGVTTEIDLKEAYRSFNTQRTLVHLLTALGAALVVGLAALSWRSRARLEDINEDLERRVEERTREARDANDAKTEFLARMSHEIRTPMNAVLGITNLLLQTDLRDAQRGQLIKVHDAARGLIGLINDILDVSKIEAGRMELERTTFDIDQLLREIVSLVPGRREVELLLKVAPAVPRRVVGDPLRLRQVLVNLVGNAMKFTERGEVVVSVDRISDHPGDDVALRFHVRDTGIGFNPRDAERFFDAFVQGDRATTRRYGGSGIGLAICKRLVGLMGGEIRADSEPGVGSTFTFTAMLGEALEDTPLSIKLVGLSALVVDQHESSREMLCQALGALGMEVSVASSKADAREILSNLGGLRAVNVVLVDWKTLGSDGGDPVAAISALTGGSSENQVPMIVLVTAFDGLDQSGNLARKPTTTVLQKPVTRSDLTDALTQVLLRAPRPQAGVEPRVIDKTALVGVRVLVVEDNELNQEVAAETLRIAGAEVVIAASGAAALETLRARSFDVVLLDIQMPGMDGYEVARRVRAEPRWRELPILATTAEALPEQRAQCIEVGMNDHLAKPLDAAVLVEVVARWAAPQKPAGPSDPPPAPEPVKAPLDSPSAADLPGFDTARALARLDGNDALLRRLRAQFCKNHGAAPSEVRAAFDQKDTERVRILAHTMKGVGATIGATSLATAAAALEAAMREPPPGAVERAAALEAFCGALDGALSSLSAPQSGTGDS